MEASCSDGWWAFWMGVIATWLPVYGAYRIIARAEESEEEEDIDEDEDDDDDDDDDDEDAENAEDARYLAMLNAMEKKVRDPLLNL